MFENFLARQIFLFSDLLYQYFLVLCMSHHLMYNIQLVLLLHCLS